MMPRYMLDTDTCSYIMKRSQPVVLKRLQAVDVGDVCMSVITKAELLHGVEVSPRRAQDAAALAAFMPYVEAIDFSDDAALHYAEIRASLKKRCTLISANDLLIAAHARALGLTLVTNNTVDAAVEVLGDLEHGRVIVRVGVVAARHIGDGWLMAHGLAIELSDLGGGFMEGKEWPSRLERVETDPGWPTCACFRTAAAESLTLLHGG